MSDPTQRTGSKRFLCFAAVLGTLISPHLVCAADLKQEIVKVKWDGSFRTNTARVWDESYKDGSGFTNYFMNGSPEENGKYAMAGSLDAWLFKPQGKGPFPFVVLLHGCSGFNEFSKRWIKEYGRILTANSIGLIAPDSFSARRVKETCGPPDPHWARRRVDDAYSALDYLASIGVADMERAFLVGQSNGGATVMMALQKMLYEKRKRKFRAGVALVPNCRGKDLYNYYAPLVLLTAEQDDANPWEICMYLAGRERKDGSPVKLIIYEGAFHAYMLPGMKPHTTHGWRVAYNKEASDDTMKVILDVIADKFPNMDEKFEFRPSGRTEPK